jgi:hypothetical protein
MVTRNDFNPAEASSIRRIALETSAVPTWPNAGPTAAATIITAKIDRTRTMIRTPIR